MSRFKPVLLTTKGRIKRRTFWIGVAVLFAVEVAFMFAPSRPLEEASYIVTTYPWICLYARRLHDLGRSGRLQIFAWLATAPAILVDLALVGIELSQGAQAAEAAERASRAASTYGWSMGLALVVSLAFVFYLGLAKGRPGPNRYGPEPGSAPLDEIFS